MELTEGVEPTTALYECTALPVELRQHGAPEGSRTPGPQIKGLLLFQLSYWRKIFM